GGDQPEVGGDGGPGEPVPVTDLHCQCEGGQGGDSSQAGQALRGLGELAVLREVEDRCVETVPAGEGVGDGVVSVIERGDGADPTGGQFLAADRTKPPFVFPA